MKHVFSLISRDPLPTNIRLKGGAVVIWSKSSPYEMEFHRCSAVNNTAGEGFEDDPQGQGGVFVAGPGTTIVLADCLFENNYAGDRVRVIERGMPDAVDGGRV